MPEYMYRFRSIDNLLGKNGRQGELEGQYIFFASPESLNDPLEGYFEAFWAGDDILWRNQLRHYISCLAHTYISFIVTGEAKEQPDIIRSIAHVSEPHKKLFNRLRKNFTADAVVAKHISALALNDRKVKRSELEGHLQVLHVIAISIVQSALHTSEYIDLYGEAMARADIEDISSRFLTAINKAIASPDPNGMHIEKLNQDIISQFAQAKFQLLYEKRHAEAADKWLDLSRHFPENYCKNITKLNFPEWYVACFMSEATDSSIWGTYGNNHSAVCLKFKTSGEPNTRRLRLNTPSGYGPKGRSFSWQDLPFDKISYDEDFVEIDFFNSLGELPEPVILNEWFVNDEDEISPRYERMITDLTEWRKEYHINRSKSITIKTRDWLKEKEYRLSIVNTSDARHRCIKYEFESLEGIIFGIKTRADDKIKIINLVERMCVEQGRTSFSFYQARYDSQMQGIKIDRIGALAPSYK